MAYSYKPEDYDPERGFAIPEIGPLRVKITEAQEKHSHGGNEMMELTLEIQEGIAKGSKLWDYIVYNEYAGNKFGGILHSCGKDPSVKRNISVSLLIGLEGEVQIKHDTYEGSKRAKVAYWRRPEEESNADEGPGEPPTESHTDPGEVPDDSSIPF